jgi:hypothetical protein
MYRFLEILALQCVLGGSETIRACTLFLSLSLSLPSSLPLSLCFSLSLSIPPSLPAFLPSSLVSLSLSLSLSLPHLTSHHIHFANDVCSTHYSIHKLIVYEASEALKSVVLSFQRPLKSFLSFTFLQVHCFSCRVASSPCRSLPTSLLSCLLPGLQALASGRAATPTLAFLVFSFKMKL